MRRLLTQFDWDNATFWYPVSFFFFPFLLFKKITTQNDCLWCDFSRSSAYWSLLNFLSSHNTDQDIKSALFYCLTSRTIEVFFWRPRSMLRLQSISNQNLLFLAQCLSPVYGDQFLLNPNQNFSQTVMVEKALRLFIFSKRQEKELRLLNSLRSKKRGRRVQLDWTVNQKRRCF